MRHRVAVLAVIALLLATGASMANPGGEGMPTATSPAAARVTAIPLVAARPTEPFRYSSTLSHSPARPPRYMSQRAA